MLDTSFVKTVGKNLELRPGKLYNRSEPNMQIKLVVSYRKLLEGFEQSFQHMLMNLAM